MDITAQAARHEIPPNGMYTRRLGAKAAIEKMNHRAIATSGFIVNLATLFRLSYLGPVHTRAAGARQARYRGPRP
jgi:hypothetical protein